MRIHCLALLACACASTFLPAKFVAAQWDAPSGYYSGATGSGAALKSQLTGIMSGGHIQGTYGDFRFSAAIHDRDPNNSANILLVYNRASVNGAWNNGITWNREHVWPQARQPGTANNSSQGNLGDPHALRPANPVINDLRADKPFGFSGNTGPFADLDPYFFPGDGCKGDIARSLFYSDTRWTSLGLSLTDNFPTGNQMGNLSSQIAWHYLDPPDEFERRRNHTIFSSAFNPQYFTNNRNAYIDRPEFVWSVYVDQQNDSTITVAGGTMNSNGQSALSLDSGRVIVGANISADQSVTLQKNGSDGTYFSVQVFEDAVSDVNGFYNAFRLGGTDSRTINTSLQYDPNLPGIVDGLIVVDNLDVTIQGGIGRGGNDGNDFITLTLTVLDHANASLSAGVDQDSLEIDLGDVVLGEPISPVAIPVHNLASGFGEELTARLDLISIGSEPTITDLAISDTQFVDLPAGENALLWLTGVPETAGKFTSMFALLLADEALPGAETQTLQLSVSWQAVEPIVPGDVNRDGVVSLLDIAPFVDLLASGTYQIEADINQDGVVNLLDIAPLVSLLTS